MPILSNIKYFYIPLAAVWLFLITRKGFRARSLAVGIVLLITFSECVATDILKPLVGRPRPYDALSHVHRYESGVGWTITPELEEPRHGESQSLPSAHATNIFAAALLLTYYFWRWWAAFYVVAFLVAYSRVYLGVHYPLDVLAGAVVGTLCGILAVYVIKATGRFFEKRRLPPADGVVDSDSGRDET
jgi:undecaprenyl-diphosphatase